MVSRKVCRFCNRKIPVTKYIRHSCKDKKIAKDFYAEWKARVLADGTPDMQMDLEKYPTFHSWDLAIIEGEISYLEYPYSPVNVAQTSYDQQSLDNGQSTEDTSEQGDEGAGLLVHPDRKSEGGFGEPRLDDTERSVRPSERKEEDRPTMKSTAANMVSKGAHVAGKFVDMVDEVKVRVNTKERGWFPIVSIQHAIQMKLFRAKEKGTKFDLTREQKKILAHSCYATFGESPLTKLKVPGEGEYDVHIVVASIDVYGEFWAENYDGLLKTGSNIWKKIRKKKEKADVEAEREADWE